MAVHKQIVIVIIALLCASSVTAAEAETTKEELVESESKDGKLEIIKRIKKVNDDGSYTIGYEADDGSFKIESRDVLGNIKGTYGFVDDEGQIKRVSYSTSNSSEIITKAEPPISVVQRIPKLNRTALSTTKRPSIVFPSSTTQSTLPTTNSVIQSIARRRNTMSSSTTTQKPNYSDVVTIGKSTAKPNHIIYTSAAPRVLLQGRNSISSTVAPHIPTQKSEGQLIRPEVVSVRPTELPLFRRLALKQQTFIDDSTKPVVEESQVRSNILRRQLAQERAPEYDLQEHVFTLQQSLGDDATDVYSGSDSTGTPRPLFTTTARPRGGLSSTTQAPIVISRPTIRYPTNYQRNILQDVESTTPEYAQESSTTESTLKNTTPTSIPVVQIPANRATPEPLVAIRHPFQRGAILVPLSQLQGRILPVDNIRDVNDAQEQYGTQQEQYIRETTAKPEVEPRPVIVRRLPPPPLRPIPVQVDENGYIRELPHQVPTPYPIPIPITPVPKYVNNDVQNDVDEIEPPVSTREFQKLLQQLILRQSRLERISALTNARRQPQPHYQEPRYRTVYQPTPVPYFVQKLVDSRQNGPVQFISDPEVQHQRQRQYVAVQPQQQQIIRQQQPDDRLDRQHVYNSDQYANAQSYVPTRRVARLLPSRAQQQDVENNEEYLPVDVREMLLLRMLQLAINPALPVEDEEMEATSEMPQLKRAPVRNVEILGEETEMKRAPRSKRYRELQDELDYYQ